MLLLRRDAEGRPCFSPDFRGVAVEDEDGLATLVDVTALPEALPPAERHEVAQTLYQGQATAPQSQAGDYSGTVSPSDVEIDLPPHFDEGAHSQAATVPPATPTVAGPDLARALAQELAGNRRGSGGSGRPLSPEEEAANVRRAVALADKAEADAALARAKLRQAEERPPQVPATIIPEDIAQAQIRAQRVALSRRMTEDLVAQTEATEEMVAIARQRVAAYHHLQAQREKTDEDKRRRALGTSNSQLFWRGLMGLVVGGMLAGMLAHAFGCDPGHCSAFATGGQLAGAWWAVASRVAKGQRAERREAYLAEREATPPPQAGTWAAGAAAMAASTLDGNTGRR